MQALGDLVSSTTLPFWVNVVAWGPGGQWIAAGGGSGTNVNPGGLAVIDAAGAIRWQQPGELPVSDIAVSPDGRWLAVAEYSWDKSQTSPMQGLARVISTDRGAERCRGPADHLASTVVFSPDGSCVAATVLSDEDGDPQRAWVFDAATGIERPRADDLSASGVRAVAFSPDGQWVTAITPDVAAVFRAADGSPRFAQTAR